MRIVEAMVSVVALGACAAAWAGSPDSDLRSELDALKSQVKNQQSEIQQLRAASGESWLTERRAEEVKTLVREVLCDADTRASLADGDVTAGHKGGHFFLASEDGNFLMKIFGQVQVRYIYNNADQARRAPGSGGSSSRRDEQVEGFSMRRAKIGFAGHIFNPKLTYGLSINVAGPQSPDQDNTVSDLSISNPHSTGDMVLEDAWFAYEFADGWQVKAGQFKAPFMHDELVKSSRQQAVERAYITDYFTVGRTQGVQVSYSADILRAMVMIHDGSRRLNTNTQDDTSDFAVAARVEVLLAGKWSQFDDYATWSSDSFGLMLGAAIDWESSEYGGNTTANNWFDILKWTVDISVEMPELMGLNVTAAVVGQSFDADFVTGASTTTASMVDRAEQIAFLVQAGIFVIPDKVDVFGRYEYIDFDGVTLLNVNQWESSPGFDPQPTTGLGGTQFAHGSVVTVGTDYYLYKHAAKATLDFVWIPDPLPLSDSGAGITRANGTRPGEASDQYVIRAQFQVLF